MCSNSQQNRTELHFFGYCPLEHQPYITDMRLLLTGSSISESEECHKIYTNQSRRTTCGMYISELVSNVFKTNSVLEADHLSAGRIRQVGCAVQFTFLIPVEISQRRAIIITSHGKHTHAPIPPTKVPIQILDDLKRLVKGIQDRSTSRSKYILKNTYIYIY